MKLRTIILMLSLLAFLSTITGAFFYYTAIKESAADKNQTQLTWHAEAIRNHFENQIKINQRAAKALSKYEEIKSALTKLDQDSLNVANQVLERFNASLETDVSYLMDQDGKTIASSNHNDPDSLVDKNYSFRPYFQKAIQGTSFVYMALGVTTGKRGIYFSHPVYTKGQKSPLGIIVMKSSVDFLEKKILRRQFNSLEMPTFITSPNGVIFMSDSDKFLFQLIEKISDDKIAAIVELKQFGDIPLRWSGFKQKTDSLIVDATGDEYIITKIFLPSLPNWQVVHLHHMDNINTFVHTPLAGKIGAIIISLCAIIGLSIAILYKIAQRGIISRKTAEDAMVERENFLNSLLHAMPIPVFYKNRAGIYEGFNDAYEVFFGKSRDQLIGKSVFDISPKELAEIYYAKDTELFDSEGIQHYESKVKKTTGEIRDVVFDKSVYTDAKGKVIGLIGTVLDITERKRIEEALKQSEERFREMAELLPGAIVETDADLRITYVNRQGLKLFNYNEEDISAGLNGFDLIHPDDKEKALKRFADQLAEKTITATDYRVIKKNNESCWVFFNASPIYKTDQIIGFRMVLNDITELKQIEKEREKLIDELQSALAEIKTLKGIVPICSNCKKIRDDSGYWDILESYIQKHSDASFSHGICPDCSDELYGKEDWYIEMNHNKEKKDE